MVSADTITQTETVGPSSADDPTLQFQDFESALGYTVGDTLTGVTLTLAITIQGEDSWTITNGWPSRDHSDPIWN